MHGQRSWFYKLLRETSYRFRPFWYSCGRNFGTISGTPSLDLEFDLECQMQGQSSWLWQLLREVSYRLKPFWYSCKRNFGTISGTPSFDLEDDLENSNECHFRVQRPKVDLGTKFEENLNPSLNPSLLHRRCHKRLFGTADVVLFYLPFW